MSRYLNSPREADWYACPSCGAAIKVGSAPCRQCGGRAAAKAAEAPEEAEDEEEEGAELPESEEDFDYEAWRRREFGRASRFKPHHLPWKYWVAGLALLLALLWGLVLAGFVRH